MAESDKRVSESRREVPESDKRVSESGRKVAESGTKVGRVGAVWGRVGTLLGRHRGDSDPPGATRGADWAHAGPARSAEWDPHLWRVALAGSDSPLPLAHSAAHSAPRHYALALPCAPPLPVRPLPINAQKVVQLQTENKVHERGTGIDDMTAPPLRRRAPSYLQALRRGRPDGRRSTSDARLN